MRCIALSSDQKSRCLLRGDTAEVSEALVKRVGAAREPRLSQALGQRWSDWALLPDTRHYVCATHPCKIFTNPAVSAGFQSLVSLLTDRPHQGLALFEYTRAACLRVEVWGAFCEWKRNWRLLVNGCYRYYWYYLITTPLLIASQYLQCSQHLRVRSILSWTSFGQRARWLRARRIIFQCIGTATSCWILRARPTADEMLCSLCSYHLRLLAALSAGVILS